MTAECSFETCYDVALIIIIFFINNFKLSIKSTLTLGVLALKFVEVFNGPSKYQSTTVDYSCFERGSGHTLQMHVQELWRLSGRISPAGVNAP